MVQRWLFAIFPTFVRHPFDGIPLASKQPQALSS